MIGKSDRVLINGYNVAVKVTGIAISASRERLEATALASGNKVYESGFRNATVNVNGLYDSDTVNLDGITDVISAAHDSGDEQVVTIGVGFYAVGGRVRMFDGCVSDFQIPIEVNKIILTNGVISSNDGMMPGRWLVSSQLNSGTNNGTAVDNGAATTNGGLFQVHLENDDATDVDVKVQHSTNGSVWVDLAAVNNLSAGHDAGMVRVATGTTVNRYLRSVATITGGDTILLSAAFARG